MNTLFHNFKTKLILIFARIRLNALFSKIVSSIIINYYLNLPCPSMLFYALDNLSNTVLPRFHLIISSRVSIKLL